LVQRTIRKRNRKWRLVNTKLFWKFYF